MNKKLPSRRYEPPFIDLNNKNSSYFQILESIGRNKTVLEIGTSTGYFSKILRERGNHVTGIEIDPEAGSLAEQYCDRMIMCDVETADLDTYLKPASFDCIICSDVLEHLKYPENVLINLKKYLKPDGYLAVSIPNFCHGDIFLNILQGDFHYTDKGLLDKTHVRFFGLKNIYSLFFECGYQISGLQTIHIDMGYTELKINYEKIPYDLLKFIQSLPYANVYQYVFKAHPVPRPVLPEIEEPDFPALFSESLKGTMTAIQAPLLNEIGNLQKTTYNLNTTITQKEAKILDVLNQNVSLNNGIIERDAKLEAASNQIAGLHTVITERDAIITEEEATITDRNASIAQKEATITDRNASIAEKEAIITERNVLIEEMSQKITSSDQYIAFLSSQLQDTNLRLLSHELEIDQMKNTITYQLTTKFHTRVIGVFLPEKTRRREVYDLGLKSGRILITEGFRKLMWHYHDRKRTLQREMEIRKNTSQTNIPVPAAPEVTSIRRPETPSRSEPEVSLVTFADIIFPKTESEVEFSIIIPVYNKIAYTLNCLASLSKNTTGSYEVIIVDDASTDETADRLKKTENLTVIQNPSNLGFVESCNVGAKSARGKYLFFLNNDTEVTQNWAPPLLDLIRNNDVGAVGAKLIYPDGTLQEAGGIIWNDASGWNYGRGDNPDKPEYNFVRDVDYCSGAALLVRSEVFFRLGGFDPRFKPGYFEDTNLCFAIRNLGYRVLYQPLSCITHHEGITSGTDLSKGMKRYQEINKQKFFDKWRETLQKSHFSPDRKNVHLARSRKGGRSILVIDHYVPTYDKDSGSYRMFNILKILLELHKNVAFISENLLRIEPYSTILQQIGTEVIYEPHVQTIESHLQERGQTYDVVILSRAHVAVKYITLVRKYCPDAKIVFDTVDLQYLRLSRQADIENNPDIYKEADRIKKTEIGLAKIANATWVVSSVEKELLLKEEPLLHIDIVSNIHDIHRSNKTFLDRQNLLFIGGFGHPPNTDAMRWFVQAIFPLIKKEIPDLKIFILGSDPPEEILSLGSQDVIVTGYVQDVSDYFENCRLFVAPLRYGAGVKGKINQSMSYGLPVVTTSIGAEGMGLVDGENVIIADTAELFAQRCIDTYDDEQLWKALSDKSISNVEEHFSYAVWKEKIAGLLNSLFYFDKITDTMKKEWNARGKVDHRYFISYSNSEEDFLNSGKTTFDLVILPAMDVISQNRNPREFTVLEIGCGAGRICRWMAGVFGEVYGVDISEEMIARGTEYCKDLKNVHLSVNNGMDLSGFDNDFFDFVFSFGVFQHIPDKNIVINYIKEVRRVLKPGSIFKFQLQGYLGKHYTEMEKDTWYGVSFSEEEMREVAAKFNFEIVSLAEQGTQFFWVIFKKR